MSAAESAPAVSRPEGGWKEGDAAVEVRDGNVVPWQREAPTDTPSLWRRVDMALFPTRISDDDMDRLLDLGRVVYVHAPREPEPVMEPLPTEACAIRATVRGEEGVVLVGPDCEDGWVNLEGSWDNPAEITAWEPLLSRAEWAERDGDTAPEQSEAEVWDEAVQAVAWAMDNGPDPLRYARENNPYRTAPAKDGAE